MAENDLSMSNMNVRVVTQELKQDPGTVHIKFNPFQTGNIISFIFLSYM